METKDYWARSRHGLPEGWPLDQDGRPEQAERLTLQSELGGMGISRSPCWRGTGSPPSNPEHRAR